MVVVVLDVVEVVDATEVDVSVDATVVTTPEVAEGALDLSSSPPSTIMVSPAAAAMIATNPMSIAGLSERRAGFSHSSSAVIVFSTTGSALVTGSARVTGVTAVGAGAGSNGDSPGCNRDGDWAAGMTGATGVSVGKVGAASVVGAPHEPQNMSPSATRSPH